MVLIGRFEQPVTYEGIHSLCFSCGRVGHRKEVCLYTITNQKPSECGVGDERENQAVTPHATHATDSTTIGTDVSDGSGVDMNKDTYGAWIMVTCRKSGQRRTRNATGMEGPTESGLNSVKQQEEERLGTNSSNVGWDREASMVEPKGVTRSGPECIKGVEANRPFVVGREPIAGHKRGVNLMRPDPALR
nr:hypothetical protein CFP56_64310 [Quercus suber]